MRARPSELTLLLAGGLLLTAESAASQVVATETVVSSAQAVLKVEAVDRENLEIAFRGGEVRINGDVVGDYEDGGDLDRSWRRLLGRVSGSAGGVAELLGDWDPPSGLESDRLALAMLVDGALEQIAADGQIEASSPARAPEAPAADERARIERILESLINGAGFEEAAQAISRIPTGELDVHIGEDVHIEDGESFEGTLVVVGADIELDGEVDGDVILSDGTLTLDDSGRVRGDVHLLDARLDREGGRISGTVVRPGRAMPEARLRDQIREELRHELREEFRYESRRSRSFARNFGGGISGILQLLVQLGILVAIGLVLLHFAPENLSRVAQVVRDYPARSAAVGMAGFFLLVPVWLVGVVALAVSIIGIPLLIAWVPLVPFAAGLATLAGFLAVSLNLGRWVQQHDFNRLRWARESNHVNHLILGVGTLLASFMAANVIGVFGHWFSFFEGLLVTVGCLALMASAVVGFGAVLLTRGGRQDMYESGNMDFDWRPRWERTSAGASTMAQDVADAATDIVDDLSDAADAALDDLKRAASDVKDEASDVVDEAVEDVKGENDQAPEDTDD